MTMDPLTAPVTLADLLPGDVIFPTITGYAGVLVGAGQIILGDATRAEWRVRHVAIVTAAGVAYESLPTIVQAMPGGAEQVEIDDAHWSRTYPVLRPDYSLGRAQAGYLAAAAARSYVDRPYSILDYAAIAGRHVLALKPTQRTPFDDYITNSGHMICSQLVDQALTDAGYHVFDDGRIPQDVTPAALYRQLLTLPGTTRLR
jgi:hypothetical protein